MNVILTFLRTLHVFDAIYKKIYDVVILSIEEPHLDALSLTKQIREKQDTCLIILISKLDNFEYLKMGYEYGCSDYLREPLS